MLQPTEAELSALAPYVSSWSWLVGEVDRRLGATAARQHRPASAGSQLKAELNERWFNDWEDFHPKELVKEVKELVELAIANLRSSDDEGHKEAVILRLVQSLRNLDRKAQFLHTIERDDLSAMLESLTELSGLNDSILGHAIRLLNGTS